MSNDKYVSPQNLSDQATKDILGDDLCVLFAIAKNGRIVRYYPYGVELPPDNLQLSDTETICFEITFCVPKCNLNLEEIEVTCDKPEDQILSAPQTLALLQSTSEGIETRLSVRRTRAKSPPPCCQAGGKETPC